MKRVTLGLLLAAILLTVVGLSVWFRPGVVAGETTAVKDRSAKGATKDSGSAAAEVEKRLNEILKNQERILANQDAILQKFDAVMEELRIIKVRATSRGS